MTVALFAGIRVSDLAAARAWYERLLGEPAFAPNATEVVWALAEDRFVYIEEKPSRAGGARHGPCRDPYLVLICLEVQGTRGLALRIDKDLVAASATPLVLAILADEESYGYAILKRVRELSRGEFEWTDGMLYPLLHRLDRLGYVTTEWRTPPEGRRRRYYVITREGRAAMAEQQRQWATVTRALGDVWRGFEPMPTALAQT